MIDIIDPSHRIDSQTGLLLTVLATFGFVIMKITLQDWVAITTGFAGLMAGAYNGYNLFIKIKERKAEKRKAKS